MNSGRLPLVVANWKMNKTPREAAAFLAAFLAARGVACERHGDSLLALAGEGPLLLLDSHLDTVPPAPGWQRPPFAATREGDRLYGLGAVIRS